MRAGTEVRGPGTVVRRKITTLWNLTEIMVLHGFFPFSPSHIFSEWLFIRVSLAECFRPSQIFKKKNISKFIEQTDIICRTALTISLIFIFLITNIGFLLAEINELVKNRNCREAPLSRVTWSTGTVNPMVERPQPTFTSSNSAMEIPKKCMKYVQS